MTKDFNEKIRNRALPLLLVFLNSYVDRLHFNPLPMETLKKKILDLFETTTVLFLPMIAMVFVVVDQCIIS